MKRPNGLWSPFGIETNNGFKLSDQSIVGQMACGARSGLKQVLTEAPRLCINGPNGLWSPFGIETEQLSSPKWYSYHGQMACGARSGLKLALFGSRNFTFPSAKWPVEPVR